MAQKKFSEAITAYETAYSISKNSVLVTKLHAAYTQAGKPDEAESRLAQWLKTRPEDFYARLYAAEVHLASGDFKRAMEQYEWLRQRQPDHVQVLNNLAWVYQQLKDPRALETAERAYKLRPENAASADTLGWILVEQGDTARGLELLQKASAAAPRVPEIRYHLALAWVKAGDKAKARSELQQLVETNAKFGEQAQAAKLLAELRD
jgi:putative PEP-CTERM system TPR-repeat lipoprotein